MHKPKHAALVALEPPLQKNKRNYLSELTKAAIRSLAAVCKEGLNLPLTQNMDTFPAAHRWHSLSERT